MESVQIIVGSPVVADLSGVPIAGEQLLRSGPLRSGSIFAGDRNPKPRHFPVSGAFLLPRRPSSQPWRMMRGILIKSPIGARSPHTFQSCISPIRQRL
jgi:hypothetical protein